MKLRRIRALARVELLHVVRDRATLAQVIFVPIIQLLVLANAATFAIRDTPAYVVDLDRSAASRGLVAHLAASPSFVIRGASPSESAARDAMLRGDATLILTIPHDFERDLVRARRATVQLDVDAQQGAAAGVVQSYAARIIDAYAAELAPRLAPAAPTTSSPAMLSAANDASPRRGAPRLTVSVRGLYNPTLDYRHYMVPGILVALVTLIGTLLTAQNIAREREVGTLEQLEVTPLSRGEFIAGKLAPFWLLALGELALGLAAGKLVFDIPMRGSLLLLFACAAVYLVVALGIGLWISTAVETQQQAMFVSFFIMMIYLLMSGLLTPIDSMPHWVQVASMVNPVRHFVTIAREILVKGAGLREILTPLAILAVSGLVVLGGALFRERGVGVGGRE